MIKVGALIAAIRSAKTAMSGIAIVGCLSCGGLAMAEVAPPVPLPAATTAAISVPMPAPASASASVSTVTNSSEPGTPAFLPVTASLVMLLVGALFIRRGLHGNTATGQPWTLADAVSEEATITEAGQTKTIMAASTSRLVAVFGMLVMLSMYLGIGLVAIWDLASTGRPPSGLADLIKFMLGGVALFAPYLVNQARAAFTSV